ncbi:TIGR03885 family FMN-dependent LLM class oxidoreductase [Streptomyces sp. SID13031]|uniref:TIGR03885 family FMN-dependent LLM class oxidoreductase n=1 Tax=Streptomyces sp. SID13031 TaxID=2706046 RepID=UPI0013C7599F|nr:TIGR03885 family FMN-dependent LLM class oxidoreductase [Streptomyces sp. SID13031]NEA37445.1 TIGR03885 family FMN-dependent LLM class oxidoreductase [Streptomyces sp. SID13031]
MTVYGFHASHEQVPPADLLAAVVRAEQAGFTAAMCSDHFSPWSERQGESGFAWAWLGAALQATGLPFGVVNAPGQRYHPAIIAQAISTLASMYPGRFWAALGTGEASNEHITGERWPRKSERNQRLEECVGVIRKLLQGEEVSHDGLVTVDRARLWTRPSAPPKLLAAAVSTETAKWAAGWGDGLITIAADDDHLRRMISAYKDNGGRGPVNLQVHLSYTRDDDEALRIAHDQWRSNVFAPPFCWDTETAEGFDQAAEHVAPDAMHQAVRISSDPGQHAEWLNRYAGLGFDAIYLHHVGKEQSEFLDVFGEKVLPQLEVTRP